MSLDFSLFADDMVIEILGHLPALDVVRYRKVCRRIFQASKERSVWINVFSRARCPLPHVDVNRMSTQDIEKLLVKMEIMDAKWTGVRPSLPQVFGRVPAPSRHTGHQTFYASMSPYVVRIQPDTNSTTYSWYREGDLKKSVLEHQLPKCIHCHDVDVGSNVLNIAYVERQKESPNQHRRWHVRTVRFEILREDVISKTLERDILWQNPLPDGIPYELKIQSGYVIPRLYVIGPQSIDLFHLDTGRIITCPIYHANVLQDEFSPPQQYIAYPYLIQLYKTEFAVFKLPSSDEMEASAHPLTPTLTHTGSFPHQFNIAHFFSRSASTLALVGLASNQRQSEQDDSVHLYFLTLKLDPHSPECQIREDFLYEARGNLRSMILAPCSSSSRSTLGLLSLQVSPPTHTATGYRIARTFPAARVYHLALRLDFGTEGRTLPNIDLTELDLFPAHDTPKIVGVSRFDPYAGQIIMQEYGYSQGMPAESEIVVIDYVSP